MDQERISRLRHISRKLVRELGMLQLNQGRETPQHWHALIEIHRNPGITISQIGQLLLLSTSATSRIVSSLVQDNLVENTDPGSDKREKHLRLTNKGLLEIEAIDKFSNSKIERAFEYLQEDEQIEIVAAIEKYSNALEKSRLMIDNIKINTLSTSRPIRRQIVSMIEEIQKDEFCIPITPDINAGILRAETEYYFNKSCNFWYATDEAGVIVGTIGLKKIDDENAELKKFFVAKKYRSKGVALKLFQTLLNAAKKHHFSHLFLGTVSILNAVHRFYEKNGFLRINKKQLPLGFSVCPLDSIFFECDINATDPK